MKINLTELGGVIFIWGTRQVGSFTWLLQRVALNNKNSLEFIGSVAALKREVFLPRIKFIFDK